MKGKDEPDYELFKKWFGDNGGLVHKIKFPEQFPPTGYTGMSAAQNIKANEVFLAIPKKLIISIQRVKSSQLGEILEKYPTLSNNQNYQIDYNILTLYLIWQKMLGTSSFFYPYLQAVQNSQTIIHWSDEDIEKIEDPNFTVEFVNELRKEFPSIFEEFKQISANHPQLFKETITWELFMESYALVMTRCFGWGLPQTMLVPYADFLNHDCHGVHHYTFNTELQKNKKTQYEEEYVRKRKQLDLTLLGINNRAQLPKSYERNSREKFIYDNKKLLEQKCLDKKYDYDSRMYSNQTKQYLDIIHKQMLQNTYEIDLLPSTDSEDNDSEDQDLHYDQVKQKTFFKQLKKLVYEEVQNPFQEPKPFVNRQFQDDITFSWWYELKQDQTYFIVASDRFLKKGQQIFNSYGRRSNKFLLAYYGFTHQNNKYDSVTFRFWDQEVYAKTGKLIFAKTLTEKDWIQQLVLGNERYSYATVTDQYRLKRNHLCYQLMAYLRLRIMRKKQNFKGLLSEKLISIHKIHSLQLERLMLQDYQMVLKFVTQLYQPQKQREKLSNIHRDYFAKILIDSNRQIIKNHFNGINILKNVINRLQKGNQNLLKIYRSNLIIVQQQLSKNNTEINQYKLLKYNNRKFTLDYFKMLTHYFRRLIKK